MGMISQSRLTASKTHLPLPRPLVDYVSGSVPPTSLPTVWPDPLFLAEHATRVWEPRAVVEVSSAPPPITPFQEGRATVTDSPAATSAASSQDAATWWPTTNVVDWVQQRELALTVEQVLDALEDRCVSGRVKAQGRLHVYASDERIRLNPADVESFSERHGRVRDFFQDITVDEWRDLTFFPLPSIQSGETWIVAAARELAGQLGPRMALRSKYLYRLVYADPQFSRDDVIREWPEPRGATDSPEMASAPARGSSNSRRGRHGSSHGRQRTSRGAYFGALERFIMRLKSDAFARMSDNAVARQFEDYCVGLVGAGKSAPPLPRDRRNIANRVRKIRQRLEAPTPG